MLIKLWDFVKALTADPVFVTLVVLSLGLALGKIKFKAFMLGSSGVFLVGVLFGALGLNSSNYITTLGLIIFMYALGIQGGSTFFNSLGKKGIPYLIIALTVALTALGGTLACGWLFNFKPETLLGIFTGSLNNSSGLAILMDNGWKGTLVSSYGIVYPLGLLSVVVYVQLMALGLRKKIYKEALVLRDAKLQEQTFLLARKFMIENPGVIGKRLEELDLRGTTGATLSRLRRGKHIIIPGSDTVFKLGDVVLAVGTEEALAQVNKLLGNETHDDLEIDPGIEARPIVITNPSLHQVTLASLGIPQNYRAVITRVWRSGMELAPANDLEVALGDSLVAVGKVKSLDRLEKFLGKSESKSALEVDLLSMTFGIALGMLLGRITFPVPGIGQIVLGNPGGAMLVGLFLGYVRRFGFLTGHMSRAAESVLKELGLTLFMAGLGIQAGQGLTELKLLLLVKMLAASLLILAATMTVTFIVSRALLKFNYLRSLAAVSGGMCSSPALETLTNLSGSEEPALIFAACYPLALLGMILASQVLAMLLQ